MKHILFILGFDSKARVTCLVLRALNMKMKAGRGNKVLVGTKLIYTKIMTIVTETLYIICYSPPPPR